MKIAIVLNTSWNIFNFRRGLIKTLLEKGHQVYTIAPRDEYSNKLIRLGCQFIDLKMTSKGINPMKDIALVFELLNTYRKIKPDIILHFTIKPNIYGTIAASLLRIPVINNICGLGTSFMCKKSISKIVMLLYRFSFQFAHKIFFQNEYDQRIFIKYKIIKASQSGLLAGSGINLEEFKPLPKTSGKGFTFLMISRLLYDKGVVEYIDAIKILNRSGITARFQLMGSADPEHSRGIPIEKIEEWINSDIVEYLGATHIVQNYIRDADCVVLPSYREGTPKALLEAASMAKPIVTTNVPGCNTVVENGINGILCRSKDSKDLAEKMKELYLLDSRKLSKMGQNSRIKVKAIFNEQLVIDKYLQAISEIKLTKG